MSFKSPMFYNDVLDRKGLLDAIYKAVNSLDGSAVLEAYKALKITNGFPNLHTHVKNYDRSCVCRNRGNDFYREQDYRSALEMYNKALLFAPKGSLEMLHAYGNRSALLFHLTAYTACLKDIETCRKLGCTGELAKKLNKRYEQCMESVWKENLRNSILFCDFAQEYFKFNVKKHPDIPCLSADVEIVSDSGEKMAVAAKDIKIGTVVAIETAFITYSDTEKSLTSCHYCQKTTLNLMPCDNCCVALFCSLQCKKRCLREYHSIECQIMDMLITIETGYKFYLTIKAFLKLKSLCKDWSTLIKEANNIGDNRLKKSSLSEIYNVENYSSILSFKEDRHFVYGALYNSCFMYASVLQQLEKIAGFFPQSEPESLEAKKCFGKLCLLLELNWVATEVVTAAEDLSAGDLTGGQILQNTHCHHGWFPFAGRLRHSCEANLLVLGLDNRVALVAIRPITKMTELTVSYAGEWYEPLQDDDRRMKLYHNILNVCSCRVCAGKWGIYNFKRANINYKLKEVYDTWEHLKENLVMPERDQTFFRETCKALAVFDKHDMLLTKEHFDMFREMRTQFNLCQYVNTTNVMIGGN